MPQLVGFLLLLLDLVVGQGCLDGILSQHRAMQLHRGQTQLFGNVCVLQLASLIDGFSLHPFGGQGTACDCRSTAKSFEFGINDFAILVHFDLQFHDITTGRCSDQSGSNGHVLLVQRAHVARVLVVFDYLQSKELARTCYL